MARILVACGTGIATSVLAANKIKQLLNARGIRVETLECKAVEVKSRVPTFRPDAIVSTTPVPPGSDVKVFSGIPLLTGIGADTLADEVAAYLRARGA